MCVLFTQYLILLLVSSYKLKFKANTFPKIFVGYGSCVYPGDGNKKVSVGVGQNKNSSASNPRLNFSMHWFWWWCICVLVLR